MSSLLLALSLFRFAILLLFHINCNVSTFTLLAYCHLTIYYDLYVRISWFVLEFGLFFLVFVVMLRHFLNPVRIVIRKKANVVYFWANLTKLGGELRSRTYCCIPNQVKLGLLALLWC